jgi:hypothetical protein
MVYEVPASKASKDQDQFPFKIGAKTFKVKKAKYLSAGQLEDLTSGDMTRILDTFGARGTAIGDAVRSLEIEQLTDLANAWTADSGLASGESQAS